MAIDLSCADRIFFILFAGFLALTLAFTLYGRMLESLVSLLILSIIMLSKGADFLVEGGSGIATRYGISHMIIGLTIVAFGTSMPELMVSVYASIVGAGGISLGNVVGSNLFNMLMVLGVPAVICPIMVKRSASRFDVSFMIFASVMFLILIAMTGAASGAYEIGLYGSVALLLLFAYYMKKTLSKARKEREKTFLKTVRNIMIKENRPLKKDILMLISGITGIAIGGQLFVQSGREIAIIFGIPEMIIGLTLMAFGTSLPEFAAGAAAAIKKKHDIAIGNVIGSNIFNLLLVAGLAAFVRPITGIAQKTLIIEIPFMIFASILLLVFMKNKGDEINRKEGLIFIALYALFVIYLLLF